MMMMMVMEGQEEAVNLCQDQLQIIKGKRTKRPRPMTSSTTTSSGGESGGEGDDSKVFDEGSEEEDMANCLILLAQGRTRKKPSESPSSVVETISKTTTSSTTGMYVHQCKTCNRCFPSFQALGGHRASHKKPKIIVNEEKNNNNKGLTFVKEDHHQFNDTTTNTTLSLQLTNNKAVLCNNSSSSKLSKVHECSICGAEFSSGQALGGHMRRHRTLITNNAAIGSRSSPESEETKKPRNVLQLDLNLPAPEDDHHHQSRESKFPFASSKEKLLVFSSSNLVDCHY